MHSTLVLRPLVFVLALTMATGAATAAGKTGNKKAAAKPASTLACSDFYQHSNATWLSANPLPPGATSFSQFDQLTARALEQQRQLLDAAMSKPADAHQQQMGAFWASGLDEAAVERAGLSAVQPLLDRISKIKRSRDVAAMVADLHVRGIPVLFNFDVDVDLKQTDRSIGYATQGGLGLPDPDYYTREDADTRALLARYRAYVEKILSLTGTPAPQLQAASGAVVAIEMRLATASQTLLQLRDPNNAYQPTAVKALDKTYPHLDLKKFLHAQGVAADSISLAHTAFFAELERAVDTLPAEQWQAYLRFHVVNALAPYLPRTFAEARFDIYGRVLAGIPQPVPRPLQVLVATDRAIGELVGIEYVERNLPATSLAQATAIADGMRDAVGRGIDRTTWMGSATRRAARAKLATLRIEIGQPQQPLDFADVSFSRDNYAGNVLAAAAWRHKRAMARIGTTGAEPRWPTLPLRPDISYALTANRLIVTAAALQPPVFDPAADAARNYGALGALIGNQLSHAFDGKGRTVDADGQLRDWWAPADGNGWDARIAPIEAQYAAYVGGNGLKVNGRMTRDENAADLSGLELAWDAWKAAAPAPAKDAGKAFFQAWAQVWPQHHSDAEMQLRLATDPHAPAQWRVNGPLANMSAFGVAFACKAGTAMQRPAAEQVTIWK